MSVAVKQILRASRPPGSPGRVDKYLPDIAQDLRWLLEKSQRGFSDRSSVWPGESLSELAAVLVEFGEDLHADAGLWRSLESYNREFFGTPLPLTVGDSSANVLNGFDPRRIQHLIWTLWMEMDPEICPSPRHANLLQFANVAGTFLTERFARLPADSGVKNFLAGPSRFGWEIKRKLVWLGAKSYLFRWFFANYVSEHDEGATVGVTDDFICQESTRWSGLGAIDILAGALDVPAEDRATLRTWHERHAAFYRVLSRQDRGEETEFIFVRNIVNGQPYTIRVDMPHCPFQPGWVVFGSLTPWRGEWYWSGEQRPLKNVPERGDANLRREMLERHPGIAYRYCPAEAAQARIANRKQHDDFVAHCGGDLAVYPDGLVLAAAEQKRLEAVWRAADPEHIRRVMRERGLEKPRPPMQFPREFLDHDQGIGAFYNPEEGQEFMLGFNHVLSGLRKQGIGLSDMERNALRHFVSDRCASPAFVHRLVREHGAASRLETFHLRDCRRIRRWRSCCAATRAAFTATTIPRSRSCKVARAEPRRDPIMPRNYVWMPTNIPPKCKLSKWQKQSLQREADQFVTEFYKPAIKPPPDDLRFNYIVDFSTKWHGAYLQFIARYACPGPNALSPFFESAFARLGYFRPDSWNIWARRHNDQWMVLGSGMTLPKCFEEMRANPWFHH